MKNLIKFSLLLALIITFSNVSFSQLKGLSISAGISNYWLLGDNPASKPIFERDTNKAFVYGGGFATVQPGTALKLSYAIDENENIVIPFGFDYIFFDAKERIPITSKTTAYLKHYTEIPSFSIGVNYYFYKFRNVDVRAFGGFDAKLFKINQGTMYRRIEYTAENISDIFETSTKETTYRIGALAYLGFEGIIAKPLYINVTYGVGAINMAMKDDARYELLTPRKDYESGESTLYNSYFSLMLKYKF